MLETITKIPPEDKKITWEEKYPAGIDFGAKYKNQIEQIDRETDEVKKTKLRTKIVEEVYQDHFKKLEEERPVFFNAEIPKKTCIPGMLRELFDKLARVLKINGDILADIKTASGEAIIDFIEHEKECKKFSLKLKIDKDQIQILVGNSNLTEKVEGEELIMPDPEAPRGRGIPLMAAYSDYFEARRNKEKNDYAFLIAKNLEYKKEW